MRIGIDARLINETGVGRYIRNLLTELALLDCPHTFVVFLLPDAFATFQLPGPKWEKRIANVHWHTVKEQLVMPWVFNKAHVDLVHIPYFNVPLLYTKPYIVTMHDLTVLHFQTGKATTLPYILYFLKWIGYYLVLRIGLTRAKHIIAVSKTVRDDLQQSLGIAKDKITVTYEGVDKKLQTVTSKSTGKNTILKLKEPYIVYVGNAYPHKNVDVLIHAFDAFKKTLQGKDFHLVLIGSDTMFYKRLHGLVETVSSKDAIQFTGAISDEMLIHAYSHAHCLVFPSLSEGFGLPALEALSLGCPVICSDIGIFHEILGSSATYFDPTSPSSLVKALQGTIGKKKMPAADFLSQYSWNIMAKQTLSLYEHIL
jgi:glycosyltransferase involved in cell wall biosynthesis